MKTTKYPFTEQVKRMIKRQLNEMTLTLKEYEKFINKVQRDGKTERGSYNQSDPTAYEKTRCTYQSGTNFYDVTVNDVTWGAEIDIITFKKGSTKRSSQGSVYIDYDTGTPNNKKNNQIIHRDKNPQIVQSAIYEIMKNGQQVSFNKWIQSWDKNESIDK